MRAKYILFLGIFLMVILTVSVFAISITSESITSATITSEAITGEAITLEAGTSSTTVTELQKFYNIAKAEVDFYSEIVAAMTSLVVSDTLTADVEKLETDLTQIQTYANSGDRASLKQFVKSTFEPDLATIKRDILAWRRTNYRSLTLEQRASLASSFNQSRNDFTASRLAAYKAFAYGRIYYFENAINIYQNRITTLKSRGLNVSSLNRLIADARTTIVDPVQNEINSATDASSLNQAIKQYALFDGSQNGINFHLASKFNVALLQIALDKLSSTSGVSQTSLTQLQNDINTANSVLSSIGTKQYTVNQKNQIWNAIKDGFNVAKSAAKEIEAQSTP